LPCEPSLPESQCPPCRDHVFAQTGIALFSPANCFVTLQQVGDYEPIVLPTPDHPDASPTESRTSLRHLTSPDGSLPRPVGPSFSSDPRHVSHPRLAYLVADPSRRRTKSHQSRQVASSRRRPPLVEPFRRRAQVRDPQFARTHSLTTTVRAQLADPSR
jgi:hypothetical protein